ncbi:MAG: hypothetical protein AB1465_06020 [Patescibacteria group bacterium]
MIKIIISIFFIIVFITFGWVFWSFISHNRDKIKNLTSKPPETVSQLSKSPSPAPLSPLPTQTPFTDLSQYTFRYSNAKFTPEKSNNNFFRYETYDGLENVEKFYINIAKALNYNFIPYDFSAHPKEQTLCGGDWGGTFYGKNNQEIYIHACGPPMEGTLTSIDIIIKKGDFEEILGKDYSLNKNLQPSPFLTHTFIIEFKKGESGKNLEDYIGDLKNQNILELSPKPLGKNSFTLDPHVILYSTNSEIIQKGTTKNDVDYENLEKNSQAYKTIADFREKLKNKKEVKEVCKEIATGIHSSSTREKEELEYSATCEIFFYENTHNDQIIEILQEAPPDIKLEKPQENILEDKVYLELNEFKIGVNRPENIALTIQSLLQPKELCHKLIIGNKVTNCYLWAGEFYLIETIDPQKYKQLDSDADSLTNEEEKKYKTNPESSDSDNDGYFDYLEINNGYNPNGPEKL